MKKIELMMEYDFGGYFKDELEGVENIKIIYDVPSEDFTFGFGYYVIQGECKSLEDVAYTDCEHNKWYLDTVWEGNDGVFVPSTWSTGKQEEVIIEKPRY